MNDNRTLSGIRPLLLALAALFAVSLRLQAGTITGQFTSTGIFTPYSGTNGTGSVVTDLTQAKSLVLLPGTNGFSMTGSYTSLGSSPVFYPSSPLAVIQPIAVGGTLWTCSNFNFQSRTLQTFIVTNSVIVINYNGIVGDGVSGDQTLGYVSMSLFLSSFDATQSQYSITTYELPKPTLNIVQKGSNAVLSWTTNSAGFSLQSSTNLVNPPIWINVTNVPVVAGTNFTVTTPASGPRKFFRLVY